MSPGHQSVDVLFEMPTGQLCVQIAQLFACCAMPLLPILGGLSMNRPGFT